MTLFQMGAKSSSIDDHRAAAQQMSACSFARAAILRQQITSFQSRQGLITAEIARANEQAQERGAIISRLNASVARAIVGRDDAQRMLNLARQTSAEEAAQQEVEARQLDVQAAQAALEDAQRNDAAARQDEAMRIAAWRDEHESLNGKIDAARQQIAELEQHQATIAADLGRAEYEHHVTRIRELKARVDEAEHALSQAQRELDGVAQDAVQRLDQWPDHLRDIRRLQRPSDALLDVFNSALAYIDLLLKELDGLPVTLHKERSTFPTSYRHLLAIPEIELRESQQMINHRERLLEMRTIWTAR